MKDYALIGIDVGVNTGFALAVNGKLVDVKSESFWGAVDEIKMLRVQAIGRCKFKVYVEDPRLRKWFGNDERKVQQMRMGVGSVKRDAALWEEFLQREGIDYEMVAPKNNKTKKSAAQFKKLTGWTKRTNEHGRDAAMLIWGR